MLKVKVDLKAWFRIALLTATSGSLARSFPNSKPVPVHTYLLSNTQWLRFFLWSCQEPDSYELARLGLGLGCLFSKATILLTRNQS
jgi:hypothetical protein